MASIVPSTDMQDKKLNQIFDWWDQNGDGWVTKDDFDKSTQFFLDLAHSADEKNKNTMLAALSQLWQLLLAAREDQTSERFGRQDFVRIMSAVVVAPENFMATIGGIVNGMLGALDRNGNGVISRAEFLEMYNTFGVSQRLTVPQGTGAEAFKRMDTDNDGVISHAELQQAIVELFTSPDPNAAGQWLLGHPEQLQGVPI